jgi:hypothetical protein
MASGYIASQLCAAAFDGLARYVFGIACRAGGEFRATARGFRPKERPNRTPDYTEVRMTTSLAG